MREGLNTTRQRSGTNKRVDQSIRNLRKALREPESNHQIEQLLHRRAESVHAPNGHPEPEKDNLDAQKYADQKLNRRLEVPPALRKDILKVPKRRRQNFSFHRNRFFINNSFLTNRLELNRLLFWSSFHTPQKLSVCRRNSFFRLRRFRRHLGRYS